MGSSRTTVSRRPMARRTVLAALGAAGTALLASGSTWARAAAQMLEALPGKRALRRLTHRPPNYETPLEYFRSVLTPNEAFFVRYHHAVIPQIEAAEFRLEVAGAALERPLTLTLAQLRAEFPPVELVAVCHCSGHRRGLFEPPVPGLQWGHGAMGNARWRGVRLADVLARAGLRSGAVEIAFDAADAAPLEGTPDYIKSLPLGKALHPDTLLAYEMNGAPLPELNGHPLRLVVPGWTATYWIKHVTRIEVLNTPASGFWMAGAYRMPRAAFPLLERFPSQESGERAPVTEIAVNSLITGSEILPGGRMRVRGIAWDAGHGIDRVDVSADGGRSWQRAELGDDLGRYSFRPWLFEWAPVAAGAQEVWSRASNRAGQTQVEQPIANPSGYQHNAFHRHRIEVKS